jgi:hypothetical protein
LKCKFGDERMYEFHDDDLPDKCFLCKCDTQKMFVVRDLKSRKMVHLCGECMVNNLSDYLLDNTRPWEEP